MPVEAFVWNEWYAVAIVDDLRPATIYHTRLLGQPLEYALGEDGAFAAWHAGDTSARCQTLTRYHTHWVSLGEPSRPFFTLPECDEPDRRVIGAGSIRVHVSGLRAIENFLDMAHFPYVHTGILGEEPLTDVRPYRVSADADSDEIFARDCRFFQPLAAASASEGIDTEYIYRVARPFVSVLYKTNPLQPHRKDAVCLFVQPLDETHCIAHTVLACIDDTTSDRDLRLFQQTIFGQDLMILSHHLPRTLPLDGGLETPARADAMSVAYRRWLRERGVRYGAWHASAERGGSQ